MCGACFVCSVCIIIGTTQFHGACVSAVWYRYQTKSTVKYQYQTISPIWYQYQTLPVSKGPNNCDLLCKQFSTLCPSVSFCVTDVVWLHTYMRPNWFHRSVCDRWSIIHDHYNCKLIQQPIHGDQACCCYFHTKWQPIPTIHKTHCFVIIILVFWSFQA